MTPAQRLKLASLAVFRNDFGKKWRSKHGNMENKESEYGKTAIENLRFVKDLAGRRLRGFVREWVSHYDPRSPALPLRSGNSGPEIGASARAHRQRFENVERATSTPFLSGLHMNTHSNRPPQSCRSDSCGLQESATGDYDVRCLTTFASTASAP